MRALEDVGDAQRQFARLEWLGQIIVGADFETLDTALRLVARGQHQNRHGRAGANGAGEIEAALARHHDVEDHEIEVEAAELCARIGGVSAVVTR